MNAPSVLWKSFVVLAAAAAPALALPGVAPLQENKPIDVDSLAALANAPAIEDITLAAALVKVKPASQSFARPVVLPGGQRAVAWSECSKAGCRGSWALLDGDNENLKVVARGALPIKEKVHFDDGYTFSGTTVADIDGRGHVEVLFHYQVTEPPRGALGSLSRDYVTMLDPAARKVIFHHELKQAGAPSEQSCSYTLIDRVERGLPAIEIASSCALRSCLESRRPPATCAPPTLSRQMYRYGKGGFVLAPPAPAPR
jgi:hypothetical protein